MADLIPPDPNQCQAEIMNSVEAFRLGGQRKTVRCKNKPTVIATETTPDKDGVCGSMSLCNECCAVMIKQLGEGYATLSTIEREYLFDVELFASFRFKASSEQEARRLLCEALDCTTINAGGINGQTLLGEASVSTADNSVCLAEVDGEPV